MVAVAAPASARVPDGQGLGIFGVFDCGDPLGEVEVFGAPPWKPPTPTYRHGGTGPHVVATRFEFRSAAGEVFFEKDFGKKAGVHVQLHADRGPGGCLHPDGRDRPKAVGVGR